MLLVACVKKLSAGLGVILFQFCGLCNPDTMVIITQWWKPDYTLDSCDEWFHFNSSGGYLKIRRNGSYFLYAQVNKQHAYFRQIL